MGKDKELQENKPTNTRLKMTISIVCLVVLSIAELYLMINYSESYLFLGLVGLAILCFVYLVTDFSFKMRREQESSLEKDFESLYKAQKVSYITVKQGIAKMEELLDDLGEELSFPLDEVLQAQKAVGRVTIQKNKENIDAVVESNEKLIGHLQAFEQKFSAIAEQMNSMQEALAVPVPEAASDRQDEILSVLARMEGMLQNGSGSVSAPDRQDEILNSLEEIEDIMRREFGREPVRDRQQEILDYLARIEASVKSEISELEVHMESKIDEIPSAVQEEQKLSPEDLEKILGETSALMDSVQQALPEEALPAGEAGLPEEFAMPVISELPGEAAKAGEGGLPENPAMPEFIELPGKAEETEETGLPEELVMPEFIEMPGKAAEAEETVLPEAPVMPEFIEMPGKTAEAEETGLPEDLTIPEFMELPGKAAEVEQTRMPEISESADVVDEADDSSVPEASDLSDSFGLSADSPVSEEIAAPGMPDMAEQTEMPESLSDGSEKVLTPEEIAALLGDSSEPEEMPEETLPMPDLSDPGHVMTPEEIAALLEHI